MTVPSPRPELLGWPPDGPRLRLDYRRFPYAGKFVMTSTGKAVLRGEPPEAEQPTEDGDPPMNDDDRSLTDGDQTLPEPEKYDDTVLAAVAFNEDRTDSDTLWLRYVTVRDDHRGEGLGPRLVEFVVDRARGRGYGRIQIAVNNPYSYEALYRAGFGYTGEQTGLAELVLACPPPAASDPERYRDGLLAYRESDHDLSQAEREFVAEKHDRGPPT
ncbi:GNAT family N-acetyltransferase [Haloarchaeobius sp. TZWWS8]|uniref:GNAT family N-acetyltransferase n=1 Tax=Haloarchaeobius sp. TZWWS8 TaxID=3446121 RepID=UPI003EC129C6